MLRTRHWCKYWLYERTSFFDIYVCSVFLKLIQVSQWGLDIWITDLEWKNTYQLLLNRLISIVWDGTNPWNMEMTVLCFLLNSCNWKGWNSWTFVLFRYAWTISICATCETQLGWLFTATNRNLKPRSFWGIRCSQLADATRWHSTLVSFF